MNSVHNLHNHPTSLPLLADDVVEFHAARLLLLLKLCGVKNEIEGLTKLAKLDFFVRYPQFFERVSEYLGEKVSASTYTVESSMVRHHYGPWDKRYYHVLAYLESRGLLTITKEGAKTFTFTLTALGQEIATKLSKKSEFAQLNAHMKMVKKILGAKNGESLKRLIYKVFDDEVAQKKMGEVIG